jgi:tetratricopeptide (TPR) repeat protein
MAEYERLMTIDPKNQVRQLIHPIYHYRLAQIYEEKGMREKALEQYQKFLDLWKDADSTHPELADARKRLSALRVN